MKTKAYEIIEKASEGYEWIFNPKTKSLWLINPETKEWLFELDKNKNLWYYWIKFDSFFKKLKIEYPDYEHFITFYIEDTLNIGVRHTFNNDGKMIFNIEDTLNIGVRHTFTSTERASYTIEDTLNIGKKYFPKNKSVLNNVMKDVEDLRTIVNYLKKQIDLSNDMFNDNDNENYPFIIGYLQGSMQIVIDDLNIILKRNECTKSNV